MSISLTAESLRSITIFVVTAKSRSFTEAAESIGITKSAVGKSIASLEKRLNTKLFNRTTRRISLTSDGEAYLDSCINALEILNSAENTLSNRHKKPSGIIKIDLPISFGRQVIMPLLIKIAQEYTDIEFRITFNDRIIDLIQEGFDLVIRFGELQSTDGIIARSLGTQEILFCVSPEYLKSYEHPKDIHDLKNHKCIVGVKPTWKFKSKDGTESKLYIYPTHQIQDGDVLVQACINGLGIIQIPRVMVQKYLDSGKLVTILEGNNPNPVDIHILWPKTRHLLPKLRLIINQLILAREKGFL